MAQNPLFPLDPGQPTYGYQPLDPAALPAVSVITPYYNTGPLFLETARSLLRQSLQQWEWIIVNDGTTDATALRVLLPFRSADPRIRVVDQVNRGLPAARNAGAALARAPLLFFLDSDDLLMPTALEKLAWSLVSHPESAFATAWNLTFGDKHFLWPRGFESRRAFLFENMATALAMVRRSAFEQVGGYDESLRQGNEDYEFWLRCAAASLWGHDLHEFLLAIRRKTAGEYAGYRWDARDNRDAQASFRREMQARYPHLYRQGLPRLATSGSFLDTYVPIPATLPFENRLTPVGQRRILMLMPWARIGGADRFALDMAAGLAARGDRISVALLRDEPHTLMDELLRITPDVFNLHAFLHAADFPRFLRSLLASRSITHVLIANSLLAYQLLPFLRAHCPNTTFVDYLHMEEEHWRDGGLPRAGLDHDALLDMHIVASQHLANWMTVRGAASERTSVCTINIDTNQWQRDSVAGVAVRAELGIDAATTVVLFPARLVAQKRPRLMAAIVRQLAASGVDFVCLVAGDGEDRGWLAHYIRRHRLGTHLRLLGAVPSTRVRELLSAADVLLLPSEQEGIALALYEAMAMGVVPVAADVGGQRELVTAECGILIAQDGDEVEEYTAALHLLIEQPAQRQRMAEAGRSRVAAHFSHPAMLDRMQGLLDGATDLAHSAPRPPVSTGQGHAAATLAIEHYTLETRLRGLAPVKLLLRQRQSPLRHATVLRHRLRSSVERFDRAIYTVRRTVMKLVRRR